MDMNGELGMLKRRWWIWAVIGLALAGCSDEGEEAEQEEVCQGLFGVPGESTGLDDEACSPRCDCEIRGVWEAPDYGAEFVDELREWELLEPAVATPEDDPYLDESFEIPDRDGVCAVVVEDLEARQYRLETFESEDEAEAAGARVTHDEACGLCSSLEDLAVYIEEVELTGPVRSCGLSGISGGDEEQRQCIQELGFSDECSQIWSWNTTNTREECLDICFDYLASPHNESDGSLNPCLQCDEDRSGEIFQAVAGRTRRNSGLPSAICRPCENLVFMDHRGVVSAQDQ